MKRTKVLTKPRLHLRNKVRMFAVESIVNNFSKAIMPKAMTTYKTEPKIPFPMWNNDGDLCDTRSGYVKTYSNRTQAENAAAKLRTQGIGCQQVQFRKSMRFGVSLDISLA